MADPENTAAETVAGLLGCKLFGFAEFILKYQIMHVVVGVVSATFATNAARRSLEKGKQSKYRTPCNGTEYIDLGDKMVNPETGNEFVLQRIRKESKTVDLREIFDPTYRSEIVKYLERAAEMCTPKRPFVLEALRYVVPIGQYETILEQISRDVFNHFGPDNGIRKGIAGNEYYEETEVYHLLVCEPTAHKKQFRFITIDESMLEDDAMPDFEDVVIEVGGKLVRARDHYQQDRWFTNQALIRGIKLDIDGLYSMFKVGEKTGRILDINKAPLFESGDIIPIPVPEAA